MFYLGLIVGMVIGACTVVLTIALVSANNRRESEDYYGNIKRKD